MKGLIIGDNLAKKFIWKYEIGTTIKNNNQNLTITDKYIKNVVCKNGEPRRYKYYKYTCNDCGFTDGNIEESNLSHGYGCSCCSGKTVVEGINDIPTTDPWMVDYFQGGYEEAKLYTCRSNKKLIMKCPHCSRLTKKEQIINNLYRTHSIGCSCSDGISYSEKFVSKLLEENNIQFIKELTYKDFSWCNTYRYDFYLTDYNCIIETHGLQHYKDSTGWNDNTHTLEEQKEIDKYKEILALQNGIEKYIVLDCRYSNCDYIINSIINSDLSKIINFNNYNFNNCIEFANSNLLKIICNYYEKNKYLKTIEEISKIFHLNRSTIKKYLQEGTKIGFCFYSAKDSIKISSKYVPHRIQPVKIIKDNKTLGVFKSITELERQSLSLFGVQLWSGYIIDVCNKKRKYYKGYYFEYISKDELFKEIDNISYGFKLFIA